MDYSPDMHANTNEKSSNKVVESSSLYPISLSNERQGQLPPLASSKADEPPPPPNTAMIDNEKNDDDVTNIIARNDVHQVYDEDTDNIGYHDAPQRLPIEYQLHEVDLTNPDMDPLEYTFRRYVPIPKAYFWDTADDSNDHHSNLPFRIKLWHRTIFYLGWCLKQAEAGGEMVANILGLNSGQFDYVTETMTEEEWDHSRVVVERRREEIRAREEREKGEEEVVRDVGLSSREVL